MKKDKVRLRRANRLKYPIIRELGLPYNLCATNRDLAKQISWRMGWADPVSKANAYLVILRYWEVKHGIGAPAPAKRKVAAPKLTKADREAFYQSREWRTLRYMALKQCGAKCQCCGASSKDGKVIHVDHVKPRYTHPHLELEITNLQVLCEDCNLGKGAWDETDWRTAPDAPTPLDLEYKAVLQ